MDIINKISPSKKEREAVNKVIDKFLKKLKSMNQYDEFLHKIQQHKMKELWDNKEDEAWESV